MRGDEDEIYALVGAALNAAVTERANAYATEGLDGNGILGVILRVDFDLLSRNTNILKLTYDELCLLIEDIAESVMDNAIALEKPNMDNAATLAKSEMANVTILATRISFPSFPMLPWLQCRSKQQFYARCEYRSGSTFNEPINTPLLIHTKITGISTPKTTLLARYYRCMNDCCRAEEPVQQMQSSHIAKGMTRCEKCREELVELPLLAVSETVIFVQGWVGEWKRNVTLLVPVGREHLLVGEEGWVIGYPECSLKTGLFYLRVAGMQSTSKPLCSLVVRGSWTGLAALLPTSQKMRILMLTRMLYPDAKLLISDHCDPWMIRQCHKLYTQVSHSEGIDPRTIKSWIAGNMPQVLFVRKEHFGKIHKMYEYFDFYFDWTVAAPDEDRIVSQLVQQGMVSNLVRGHLDPKLLPEPHRWTTVRWSQDAHGHATNYFAAYRDVTHRHNDACQIPIHHPAKQLSLLSTAAEHAASLRGGTVEMDDVAWAVSLMEVTLQHRYGETVFQDTMMTPCTSDLEDSFGSLVALIRNTLCI
ncbi:hypothetical protein PSACC_01428 [Paramicrosporidium saccamoebae]|uniref:Uncharacterized protein n=1 Tax=Paramicrosporidium saccamoebae TaxID=1246581 RepID=A0A2H9TLV4_9FUNG|nr:hypothetical protein PSACC_01428 [Paramicrosporidium saccamoebae]